jgi:hypothetical protein
MTVLGEMAWFMAVCAGDVVASVVDYVAYSVMLYVYGVRYFLHVGNDHVYQFSK